RTDGLKRAWISENAHQLTRGAAARSKGRAGASRLTSERSGRNLAERATERGSNGTAENSSQRGACNWQNCGSSLFEEIANVGENSFRRVGIDTVPGKQELDLAVRHLRKTWIQQRTQIRVFGIVQVESHVVLRKSPRHGKRRPF